jgi:hypothetical protein
VKGEGGEEESWGRHGLCSLMTDPGERKEEGEGGSDIPW